MNLDCPPGWAHQVQSWFFPVTRQPPVEWIPCDPDDGSTTFSSSAGSSSSSGTEGRSPVVMSSKRWPENSSKLASLVRSFASTNRRACPFPCRRSHLFQEGFDNASRSPSTHGAHTYSRSPSMMCWFPRDATSLRHTANISPGRKVGTTRGLLSNALLALSFAGAQHQRRSRDLPNSRRLSSRLCRAETGCLRSDLDCRSKDSPGSLDCRPKSSSIRETPGTGCSWPLAPHTPYFSQDVLEHELKQLGVTFHLAEHDADTAATFMVSTRPRSTVSAGFRCFRVNHSVHGASITDHVHCDAFE